MRPTKFECRITPRNSDIRAAIEQEGRQALRDLSPYDGETKYRLSKFYQDDALETR
jgi:hypothetical protein